MGGGKRLDSSKLFGILRSLFHGLSNGIQHNKILGGTGSQWYRSKFSWTFGNLLSMDFPVVYDTTILNDHPILVIFGTGTNFRSGQEVGRADRKVSTPLGRQLLYTVRRYLLYYFDKKVEQTDGFYREKKA